MYNALATKSCGRRNRRGRRELAPNLAQILSGASTATAGLADSLLTLEAGRGVASPGRMDEAIRVCERLRPVFARLAGTSGFVSFLTRAVALARRAKCRASACRSAPTVL